MARGYCLLIDYGADVESLRHVHIVEVLHHCHRLPHTQPFGGKAGKYVCLRVLRQGHEGLCVAYSLLHQHSYVASVAVNHHCVGVAEQLIEPFATFLVALYYLHVHVVGHRECRSHRGLASAHYYNVLHVGIMFLTRHLSYIRYILACSHEVGEVHVAQLVVTARNDGIAATFYRHYVVRIVGTAKFSQWLVEYLARLAQLNSEHHQRSSVHVPPLSHPAHLQSIYDVLCGKNLRINQRVDT